MTEGNEFLLMSWLLTAIVRGVTKEYVFSPMQRARTSPKANVGSVELPNLPLNR
jgi:hypothetical protein